MKIASLKYGPKDYSEGQIHEMLITLGKFGFSPAMSDIVANGKSGKAKEIVRICGGNPYADLVADWERFYQDVGISVDFSNLVIPAKQDGFDRLIIEAGGLTPQKVYNVCERLFKCRKWIDKSLDEVITHSDRIGLHAVWVRERKEADEELKNLSANQLKELVVSGITFNERGLYEAKYFKETGQHLDMVNITLCSGSRCFDGGVPGVSWGGWRGCMGVSYYAPSYAFGLLRSRQAVS